MLPWVADFVNPCLGCGCHEDSHYGDPNFGEGKRPRRFPKGGIPVVDRSTPRRARLQRLRTPGHEVELVVSALVGMHGAAGYHTSVLIAGEEYFFSPAGITAAPRLVSHPDGCKPKLSLVGLSLYSGCEMLDFLTQHFKPGTYDMLLKNCNTFTDCALYFLCERRLWPGFRAAEQLGTLALKSSCLPSSLPGGLSQMLTGAEYLPNPLAEGFDLDELLAEIGDARATSFVEAPAVGGDDDIHEGPSPTRSMPAYATMKEEHRKGITSWKVSMKNGVRVRNEKSVTSSDMGVKYRDLIVQGYEEGNWLKLADENGYVLIRATNGHLLEPVGDQVNEKSNANAENTPRVSNHGFRLEHDENTVPVARADSEVGPDPKHWLPLPVRAEQGDSLGPL